MYSERRRKQWKTKVYVVLNRDIVIGSEVMIDCVFADKQKAIDYVKKENSMWEHMDYWWQEWDVE